MKDDLTTTTLFVTARMHATEKWAWVPTPLWRMNFRLGRVIFADDDSLSHHLRSEVKLHQIRRKAGYHPRPSALFSAEDLAQQGYVLIRDAYSSDLVDLIRTTIKSAMKDSTRILPRQKTAPDGKQYSFYLRDLADQLPALEALITGDFVDSMNNFYRASMKIHKVKCYRNYSVPLDVYALREIYSNRWHCDHSRGAGLIKAFYLVDDVSDADGPFCIQSRKRTRKLMRNGFGHRNSYQLSHDELEDPRYVVKLTGPAGTMMVCDTTVCLHRASELAPGRSRDIIQFQILPSSEPLRDGWLGDPNTTRLTEAELGRADHFHRPGSTSRA